MQANSDQQPHEPSSEGFYGHDDRFYRLPLSGLSPQNPEPADAQSLGVPYDGATMHGIPAPFQNQPDPTVDHQFQMENQGWDPAMYSMGQMMDPTANPPMHMAATTTIMANPFPPTGPELSLEQDQISPLTQSTSTPYMTNMFPSPLEEEESAGPSTYQTSGELQSPEGSSSSPALDPSGVSPPTQSQPRPQRTRNSKPADPAKASRDREKNRAAAAKCRRKVKRSADDLQVRERDVSEQHRRLSAEATRLRNEVLILKNEILNHGECDNEEIQNYIAGAARDLRR